MYLNYFKYYTNIDKEQIKQTNYIYRIILRIF